MRFSIQAAMVCRKHNDRSISSMKESCPCQWATAISERPLKLVFHLFFQHHGIRQRSNTHGDRHPWRFLEEGAFAGNFPYRCRQKGIAHLNCIQCLLPLVDSSRPRYLGDRHVEDGDTLLNQPKELFERIEIAKLVPLCIVSI